MSETTSAGRRAAERGERTSAPSPRAARRAPTVASVLLRSVEAHGLGGRTSGVSESVRRAAGVYGAGPTAHLALLARTRRYAAAMLENAVGRSRELVRMHAMRGSIYLMPRDWVPHALALTRAVSAEHYTRTVGITERGFAALAARIERAITERPRTASEIRAALGGSAPEGTGLTMVLGRLGREGRIVRTAVRGGLRSQSYEYASTTAWLGPPRERPTRDEALRSLAASWLQANGPATVADLAWWSGAPLRDARRAMAALGTRTIRIGGIDGELHATDAMIGRLGKAPEDDAIHLLPCWDSYLMAHRDRARYLDPARRPFVVDRGGNVTSVMLRAGRVVGVWDLDGRTLKVAPFERLPRPALEAAAARLAPLHAVDDVVTVEDPRPLAEGGPNTFLAPLKTGARRRTR